MSFPNVDVSWKWFVEAPLTRAWRDRLELCLGVVLAGAAVVALSTSIRPDPVKLAALHHRPVIASRPYIPPRVEAAGTASPEQMHELKQAIVSGNVSAMNRAWVRGMPMDGMVSIAARAGRKEGVQWVLSHGGSVHEYEHSPMSPILVADDAPEIATLLRAHGAPDPSLQDAAAALAPNALLRTIGRPRSELSDALVAAAGSGLGTALNKHTVVVKLLDAGADVNTVFLGRSTALGGAVQDCNVHMADESHTSGCMVLVHQLLDRGAHVSGDALGAALSLDDGHRNEVLDLLFERPFEPGVTAIALTQSTSIDPHDLKRVVARGVDWAWHDGEDDAAIPVLSAAQDDDRDMVRAFLDAGAPVDVHFKDGSSVLAAALDGSGHGADFARIVELLVERGANVNRRLPDGRTPLFAAAESGDIRVVNFLLAHGARVNDVVLYDTALDAAMQHDNVAAARIIQAHGGTQRFGQRAMD